MAPIGNYYGGIIPYQEPSGNYNSCSIGDSARCIIPYQEPSGNYNMLYGSAPKETIIPYQEPSGNYNTTARIINFLTIIPYQEPSGNYNLPSANSDEPPIIPSQEPSGNYNVAAGRTQKRRIIPYQEPSGNYNSHQGDTPLMLYVIIRWNHQKIKQKLHTRKKFCPTIRLYQTSETKQCSARPSCAVGPAAASYVLHSAAPRDRIIRRRETKLRVMEIFGSIRSFWAQITYGIRCLPAG